MITDGEVLIRILLAAAVGMSIGWEREHANRPAGIRTYALVCVGAALFTILSMHAFGDSEQARVAAQIITGIGFLGAGTIFKFKNKVRGLTTAAGLWAIAAVGMGYGAGFYFGTSAAAVIVFLLLRLNKSSKTRKIMEREVSQIRKMEHKLMRIDHFVKRIERDQKGKRKKS